VIVNVGCSWKVVSSIDVVEIAGGGGGEMLSGSFIQMLVLVLTRVVLKIYILISMMMHD